MSADQRYLYVADNNHDRIAVLDPSTLTIIKGKPFDFNGPRYLGSDSNWRLYVADKYAHKIKVITPDK